MICEKGSNSLKLSLINTYIYMYNPWVASVDYNMVYIEEIFRIELPVFRLFSDVLGYLKKK